MTGPLSELLVQVLELNLLVGEVGRCLTVYFGDLLAILVVKVVRGEYFSHFAAKSPIESVQRRIRFQEAAKTAVQLANLLFQMLVSSLRFEKAPLTNFRLELPPAVYELHGFRFYFRGFFFGADALCFIDKLGGFLLHGLICVLHGFLDLACSGLRFL